MQFFCTQKNKSRIFSNANNTMSPSTTVTVSHIVRHRYNVGFKHSLSNKCSPSLFTWLIFAWKSSKTLRNITYCQFVSKLAYFLLFRDLCLILTICFQDGVACMTRRPNVSLFIHFCYRAMHVVLARYCYRKSSVRQSVCLSVCPSVTLRYAEHIGCTSSKLITRIISLGSSLLGATTSAV